MNCQCHETFLSLLQDAAHWEFETFLIILFDVVIGYFIWQKWLKKHYDHHVARDKRDNGKI